MSGNDLVSLSGNSIMVNDIKQKKVKVRDLFDIVTESLKLIPVAPFRLVHPYRFKLGADALNQNQTQRLQLEPVSDYFGDDFTPRTRAALKDSEAFYFLGENISQQDISSSNSNTFVTDFQSPLLGRLSRSKSVESFNLSVSNKPCMIRMPLGRSHLDLGDCFGAIPLYAWFLPYVLSCAPQSFIVMLAKLPPLIQSHSATLSTDLLWPQSPQTGETFSNSDDFNSRPPTHYSIQNEFYRRRNLPQPFRSRSFGSFDDAVHTFGDGSDSGKHRPNNSGVSGKSTAPDPPLTTLNTSWRSLGLLMLSKDPVCHAWEAKRVCLLDNFLVELTTDGSCVIGFTPLCGASVTKLTFSSHQCRRDKLWRHTQSTSASDLTTLSDSQITTSTALLITCYTTSQISICPTASFYLTTLSADDEATVLSGIESAVQSASSLSVSDVFNFGPQLQQLAAGGDSAVDSSAPDSSLLGRGRYAEVRLATRISDRDLFARHLGSVVHSAAKMDSGIQTPSNRENSEDLSYSDHVRDRSSSLVSIPETCAMFDYSLERLNVDVDLDGAYPPYPYSSSYSGGLSFMESSPASDPVIAGIAYRLKSDEEGENENGASASQPSTTEPDSPVSDCSRSPRYNDTSDSSSEEDEEEDGCDMDDLDGPSQASKPTGISFPGVTCPTVNNTSTFNSTFGGTSKDSTTGAVSTNSIYRIGEGVNEEGGGDSEHYKSCSLSPVGFAVEKDKGCGYETWQEIDSAQPSPTIKTASVTPSASPPCAVKLVSKEIFWSRICKGQERTDSLVREVLSQALVSGLFGETIQRAVPIVRLVGVLETIDGFVMQLEVMDKRDLFDLLAQEGPMAEQNVAHIITQLVEAVAMCNCMGFAHRDIKLSNITFPERKQHSNSPSSSSSGRHSHPTDLLNIKLADFGMAGFADSAGRLKGRCGTPGYVAPDILCAEKSEPYPLNVDMFSVGVAAYTLLVGYEPFYGADNKELMEANKRVQYEFARRDWSHVSEAAQDFIGNCLLERADDRLTPQTALQHEWLKDAARRYREESEAMGEANLGGGCSIS